MGKSKKWLLPLIICYFLYILFFRLQIFCTREGIEGHYSVTRRLFRIRWRTTPRPPIILQNGAHICLLFWPLKVSTFRWNLISDFLLLTFQHSSRVFICSNRGSLCSNHALVVGWHWFSFLHSAQCSCLTTSTCSGSQHLVLIHLKETHATQHNSQLTQHFEGQMLMVIVIFCPQQAHVQNGWAYQFSSNFMSSATRHFFTQPNGTS